MKPIIFSGEMVRALLDGRKTQTRRVVKYTDGSVPSENDIEDGWPVGYSAKDDEYGPMACPYGDPRDRLYVRETFEYCDEDGGCESVAVAYKADDGLDREVTWIDIPPDQRDAVCEQYPWDELTQRWRPSIHMPRWASRITLEVTGVRVERVRDISPPDVMREGAPICSHPSCEITGPPTGCDMQLCGFRQLWDSINAKRPGCSWADNPYVWVIEFKRVEQ